MSVPGKLILLLPPSGTQIPSTWHGPSANHCSVGLNIPKLLPITATFAAPLSLYYIVLSARVVGERLRSKTYTGEGEHGTQIKAITRSQINFAENVPLALMLAAFAELNGANRRVLAGALGALTVFRVLHADFGLLGPDHMGFGRAPGFFGTIGVLGMLGTYGAYLVKGYWGF